jgi:hypothetical protein
MYVASVICALRLCVFRIEWKATEGSSLAIGFFPGSLLAKGAVRAYDGVKCSEKNIEDGIQYDT